MTARWLAVPLAAAAISAGCGGVHASGEDVSSAFARQGLPLRESPFPKPRVDLMLADFFLGPPLMLYTGRRLTISLPDHYFEHSSTGQGDDLFVFLFRASDSAANFVSQTRAELKRSGEPSRELRIHLVRRANVVVGYFGDPEVLERIDRALAAVG